MMSDIVELDGRRFVAADQLATPEWPCVSTERPQPTLTLKDNDLFLVTDTLGNIAGCLANDANDSMGLFCSDTRFLSRLELQIERRSPVLLSSTAEKGFALSVLCTNPRIEAHLQPDKIGIQREIVLNGGLFEELKVSNYSTSPVSFELSLSFAADFVDLFQVRGFTQQARGQLLRAVPDTSSNSELEEMTLAYQSLDGAILESHIHFIHHKPDLVESCTAVWHLELESHQTQKLGYRLQMLTNQRPTSIVSTPITLAQAKAAELIEQRDWCERVTQIRTDGSGFNQVLQRAEQDIYLLLQSFRSPTDINKGTEESKVLAAGVPWFSTLFGRDAIISAWQTLMLDPSIARETLNLLAYYQGKTEDEWRDEQPGKILHEIRLGELARCHKIPHTPYYGTVDATPLWLMLYSEYYAWTDDQETMEHLWPHAVAAMEWIDQSCEKGYLSYLCKSQQGLPNQGWKDSDDCIVNRQGHLATGPIALCEVQAYVYAAKIRLSELARLRQRPDLAERWQEQARNLKLRFNQDFWMAEQDYCALALDGQGRQVDSITSNPGHCLNFGIFLPEKAYSVAERLRAPDMLNGWGIRTLSSLSPAYNPMGYHVGSVWPHDNALIALGLRSLGLIDQALELCQGLIDMTLHQPYFRPPELFCGYERVDSEPVRYPVACSPQAWATGSILQLVQMMTNLVPDAPNNRLRIIDPALPASINHLALHNLRVGPTLLDLEFERAGSTTACRVVNKRGNLRVIIEA